MVIVTDIHAKQHPNRQQAEQNSGKNPWLFLFHGRFLSKVTYGLSERFAGTVVRQGLAILSGMTQDTLAPQGTAMRAETAVILARFAQLAQ